jgi:hypothetical protein
MQSLLPAQLASSVVGIAQTPVKAQAIDDMAQELAAVELASPQLLFSPPLAVAGPQQIPQSPFLSQSPTKQTSSSPQKSPVKSTTPQLSPQRLVTVPMTPLSVLKYTEKDLISFKSQWQQQVFVDV